MNMSYRCFNIIFVTTFVILISMIASIVIIIDPAFHFHAPLDGISYLLNKERYQNNGIVKHFDYDAVITGTSMVENTKSSEVDELFGVESVKVCFMGASYREISDNIYTALNNNPDIKLVIRAVDPSGLIADPNTHISNESESGYDYPTYLYDNNPFNDIEYVLNLRMLGYAVSDIMMTLSGQETTSFDEYSNWNSTCEFSKSEVLLSYTRPEKSEMKPFSEEDKRLVYDNIENNIIKQAKMFPDVEFYIWIPPYSICYYDIENQKGNLNRLLSAIEYEFSLLTDVPNIKLYSFIDRYDITTDLTLYKDYAHYSEDVNSTIINAMKNGQGMIDKDNYRDYMKKVNAFYKNYDYESIYK